MIARVVLLLDPALGGASEQALNWAQSLADALREPVDVGFAVTDSVIDAIAPDNEGVVSVVRLDPDPPVAPMSAADFVWDDQGRPAWSEMWGSFCELALFGGPPHRGPDTAIIGAEDARRIEADSDVLAEVRRGIFETSGLFSEPAEEPGWLAISCDSSRMAAWMAASIILENVEARCAEEQLLVPISDAYTLKDEIKSTITVVAKVHHYWMEHVATRS